MKGQMEMGRYVSIAAIVCAGMILLMAGVSNAATEGRMCIPEPTDEPIDFGELINCEINPVGDMDTFRFDGSDGDRIRLHAISRSPDSTVCVELFDPDEFRLTRRCLGTVEFEEVLDDTGEYYLKITENGNNSTMDYSFLVERISPHSDSATEIIPGDMISDSIDPEIDMDLYYFQGSDGDRIRTHATSMSPGSTVCVELYDPAGFRLTRRCLGTVEFEEILDMDGEYSVLVTENGINSTMDYKVLLERICPHSDSATKIIPGDMISDSIDPAIDMDLYYFQGSDGDRISLEAESTSPGSTVCVELYDPDCFRLTRRCLGTVDFEVILDKDGEYSVLITENGINSTMDYLLKFNCDGCPDPDTFSYFPVTPCRIVDTRNTSAGIIDANTQRNFRVFGSVGFQGGKSSGCPSPFDEPHAAHLNMVAVNPTGKGNLQAFPVGAGTGAGLSVNYNTIDTNLANAGSVGTVTGAGPDITVASNFSSAHTVIDVLGYYYPDEGFYYTPVDPCRIADTRKTSAGKIDANTERDFRVFGPVGDQGGNPAGCPSTLGVPPKAAHLNMVAVNPAGKGNLQAFPADVDKGAGLSVNYNTIDTNLANAGTVGTSPDISVASNFSSAHTVIDVLGYYSEQEDLLYTPVTPCRIVDTRKTTAGIIDAGTKRDFRVFGPVGNQGGESGGCSSPGGAPDAVHINMVAVNPTGKGNLQAFPVGAVAGAGLSVNYNTIDTNLANAGTVKATTGTGPDISVASNFSSAHTVIDVLGYYYPAP